MEQRRRRRPSRAMAEKQEQFTGLIAKGGEQRAGVPDGRGEAAHGDTLAVRVHGRRCGR